MTLSWTNPPFWMGLFPKKMCLFFDSCRKTKQLCRRIFFNLSLFSLRKQNLKIQQKRSFLFLPSLFSPKRVWENREGRKRNDSFYCRKIEFSNEVFSEKRFRIEKKILQNCFFIRYESIQRKKNKHNFLSKQAHSQKKVDLLKIRFEWKNKAL
jgi:hypothetical protein